MKLRAKDDYLPAASTVAWVSDFRRVHQEEDLPRFWFSRRKSNSYHPELPEAPPTLELGGDSYFFHLDSAGRITRTSPALARLLPAPAPRGMHLSSMVPLRLPECEGPIEGWPQQISLALKGREGTLRYFEAALLRSGEQATLLLLDVSAHRVREEYQYRRRQVMEFCVAQAIRLRQAPTSQISNLTEEWLDGLCLRMQVPALGLFVPAEQGWTLLARTGSSSEGFLWTRADAKAALGIDDGGGPRLWRSTLGESFWLVPYREHDGVRAWLAVGGDNALEQVPYFSRLDWNIMLMLFASPLSSSMRYAALQHRLQRTAVIEGLLDSGWWEYDPATGKMSMAPDLARSLGLQLDATDSIPLDDAMTIIDPSDRDMLRDRLNDLINSGNSFSESVQLRLPGGGRWLQFKGERVTTPTLRIVGYVLDISELRRQQEETAAARARLEGLVDNAPALIYVQRHNEGSLHFEFCSASLCKVLGWSLTELQSEPFSSFLHPADRSQYYQRTRSLLQSGYSSGRYRLRDRTGNYHWMLDEAKLLRDTRGTAVEVVGLMIDVTDATEAAERIRQSEERYRVLVEDSPAVICRYLPNGTLTFANQTMIKRLGLSAGRISDYDLRQVMNEEDIAASRARQLRMTPNNPVSTVELKPKTPDGTRAIWIWSERGMFDEHGRLVEIQAIGRDETLLYEAREQLHQSAKMAILGEMATGLAHEMSQPFTVIRMALANIAKHLGRDELDPSYLQSKLERVESQVARAMKIVDHVRIFGRRSEEKGVPFDPCNSIGNLVLLMENGSNQAQVKLEVEVEQVPMVEGHQDRLEQVLLNLALNAQYAAKNRSTQRADAPWVKVSCRHEDGEVIIEVEDNGDGIEPSLLNKIFEPFMTTKPAGSGTGLGLSLSHSIITQMRGKLTAFNTGSGACFRICLPACSDRTDTELPASTSQGVSHSPEGLQGEQQ